MVALSPQYIHCKVNIMIIGSLNIEEIKGRGSQIR